MSAQRNILILAVDEDTYGKFAPVLQRANFDIDRMHRGESAVELINEVPFHVLIAGFPLPDIDLRTFTRTVRGAKSPCLRSPFLLLVTPEKLSEAEQLVGLGVNRVVSVDSPAEILQQEVTDLLKVAPRVALRMAARLTLTVGTRKPMLCQTLNMSSTGMLIRTPDPFPIGATVTFELSVPQDPTPVRGTAEVVRHTRQERENLNGMGVRFCSFDLDSEQRLGAYLATIEDAV
jgi:CheY-like chemotaxis protein